MEKRSLWIRKRTHLALGNYDYGIDKNWGHRQRCLGDFVLSSLGTDATRGSSGVLHRATTRSFRCWQLLHFYKCIAQVDITTALQNTNPWPTASSPTLPYLRQIVSLLPLHYYTIPCQQTTEDKLSLDSRDCTNIYVFFSLIPNRRSDLNIACITIAVLSKSV